MQPAYGAYPYAAAQAPYPYYAPPTPFPAGNYPNGGGRDPFAEYETFQQPWSQAGGQTSMPRPQHLSERKPRRADTTGPSTQRTQRLANGRNKPPLKSALKNHRSASDPTQIRRTRTNSGEDPRRTLKPTTRARTSSSGNKEVPDHMFVSLIGSSELRVQNASLHLVAELRNSFLHLWPYGVLSEGTTNDNTWTVNFSGTPWSSTGTNAIMVLRMIKELFTHIDLSYEFLTTINPGQTSPRLAFAEVEDKGIYIRHFVAYFSRSGQKLTLVDPPDIVGEGIGSRLRSAWPHKIASDKVVDHGIYTVSLKSTGFGSYALDKHLFMSFALQEIRSMGYKLVAGVPLARRGPLGMGSRREVWVFRDMMVSRSRPRTPNA